MEKIDAILAAAGEPLSERARLLSSDPLQIEGQFILYWMRTAVRSQENPALDLAIVAGKRTAIAAAGLPCAVAVISVRIGSAPHLHPAGSP